MSERAMTASWTEWQGMVVDGTFYLDRYLGGSERSAVYFTDWGEENKPAAIKFIAADQPQSAKSGQIGGPANADAESHLSRWKLASELHHPNLLRVYQAGRCELGGERLLYVVMEYAEENLAELLRERPLDADEAREMTSGVLTALAALHHKGLVHGHLKPSNIMAIGDQLKISTDGISPQHANNGRAGDPGIARVGSRAVCHCAYDAPELSLQQAKDGLVGDSAGEPLSPSADIWSLGVTLVEALTQQRPTIIGADGELEFAAEFAAPFHEIAQHCLLPDPSRRWTIAGIRAHLAPAHSMPAQAQGASEQRERGQEQVAQPERKKAEFDSYRRPAEIAASKIAASGAAAGSSASRSKFYPSEPATGSPVAPTSEAPLPDWVAKDANPPGLWEAFKPYLPVTLAALVFFATAAVLFTTHSSRRGQAREAASSATAAVSASAQASIATSSNRGAASRQPDVKASAASSLDQSAATQSSWVEAFSPNGASQPEAMSTSMSGALVPGAAIERPLPEIPRRARRSIHGRVKVKIKVAVGPSGSVERATLDSHSSSPYFAGIAMEAARRWRFSPAQINGQNVASEWLLKFEFRRARTDVHSTPLTAADQHL